MDSYIYVLVALLPLSASMVVFQVNPYHALVLRGILGAVAAMVYAVLGAADVSLTEALVGTMLAITLYAVAVRSSMVVRLGVLRDESSEPDSDLVENHHFGQLLDDLRAIFRQRHLRLELVTYEDPQDLNRALIDKEVHATCVRQEDSDRHGAATDAGRQPYHTVTRVRRIYEIVQAELASPATNLTCVSVPEEKHS